MSMEPVKFTLKRKSDNTPKFVNTNKDDESQQPDYISNASDLDLTRKPKKRKNLVIPSPGNLWQPAKNQNMDDVTKEAINQILKDPKSVKLDEKKSISSGGNTNSKSSLQFPGVEPQKEATLDDYADVPVSDFGKALMRGMGWEEGKGVGRKRVIVPLIDFETRKRTLGVTIHEEETAEAERLSHEYSLGDYIEICSGQNKGNHAKILSISIETYRCIVRLPSEEIVDVAITAIQKGCKVEYLKQRDASNETEIDPFSEKPSKPVHDAITVSKVDTKKKLGKAWLHRDLKVRVICQDFENGRYYCKKFDIVNIVDPFTCICKTEKGKLIENVPQSILETVIPKKKGSLVMLLSKSNRFEIAELEEKDSKSGTVICVTLLEKDVVTAYFDEVCQYVGDAIR